jgi:4-hydroxy-tetrahydrodipicolinate reductase
MKIALLGYGKMGKSIESVAQEKGHQIVAWRDKSFEKGNLSEAEVAINFSVPDAAVANIKSALDVGLPVVCGTTGWLSQYDEITDYCTRKNGAFLYASNFSIGVNLFFKLNSLLAQWMQPQTDYSVSINETHHTQKLDAPSGTALHLAESILAHSDKQGWTVNTKTDADKIPITSLRQGTVPGTHTVSYHSKNDIITLQHEALSRTGFALGALVAAAWILNKKGIFSMDDVLKLS